MKLTWRRLEEFFRHGLWAADLAGFSPWRRRAYFILRLLLIIGRDFSSGDLTLRAMSLVYTTLLSLVPLLAVSFSVLKAFGVHNQVEPLLLEFLAPLGAKGEEIVATIIRFVENINVGVLGSVGVALLFYTVVSLISKIEQTFNHIWRVRTPRRWAQRFSDYLSVLLIGPVLVFAALGIAGSMMSGALVQRIIAFEPFGTAFYLAGILVPYVLTIAAFAFVYIFIPNVTVRIPAALAGSTIAGLMWKLAGWLFASFVAGSARYHAIYSGFAVIIFFMIWLYVSWLIFILGAQITFYVQRPEFVRLAQGRRAISNRLKEKLALILMFRIAHNHYHGQPAWTLDALAQRLGVPGDILGDLLAIMEKGGYIVETADNPETYVPARDLDTILLEDFLATVRSAGDGAFLYNEAQLLIPEVEQVLAERDRAAGAALGGKSVRRWVAATPKED